MTMRKIVFEAFFIGSIPSPSRVFFSDDNKMLMPSCMGSTKEGGTLGKCRGIRNAGDGRAHPQRPHALLLGG